MAYLVWPFAVKERGHGFTSKGICLIWGGVHEDMVTGEKGKIATEYK